MVFSRRRGGRGLLVTVQLVLVGLLFLALGCDEKKPELERGSGVEKRETRPVGGFTRLAADGPFEVEVTIGPAGPLELSGDDNLLPLIEAKLENGRLHLIQKKATKPVVPLRIKLATPGLEALAAGVTAKMKVTGLKAERLELTGAGASKITAAGSADTLEVSGRMVAQFDLAQLPARSAKVKLEKASRVELGYLEKLDVALSGASRVTYPGDPEVKKDVREKAQLVRRPQ